MFCFALGACAGLPPPYKEYNIARTALNAARKARAPEKAPGYWARAQKDYLLAEQYYKNAEYKKAKEAFLRAKLFSERAENYTALKNLREGGDL